jgi:hypothetical protein
MNARIESNVYYSTRLHEVQDTEIQPLAKIQRLAKIPQKKQAQQLVVLDNP